MLVSGGLLDLGHARRPLPRRRHDLRRRLRRLAQGLRQGRDRLPGPGRYRRGRGDAARHLFRREHGRVRRLLDLAEDLPHLRGGLLRLIGQGLDLARHHGEALAVLAGTRGFDGGVEGEQVRLLGDVVDRRDDLADRLRLSRQRQDVLRRRPHLMLHHAQGVDGVLDSLASPPSPTSRDLLDGLAEAPGPLRRLLGRLRHLRHGRNRLGDGGGLFLRAGRLLRGAGQDLGGRRCQLADRLANALQGALAFLGHAIEGLGQLADFIIALDVQTILQLAASDLFRPLQQPMAIERPAGWTGPE